MLDIQFKRNNSLHRLLSDQRADFAIRTKSLEEKVKLLIVRDLLRLGWEMNFKASRVLIKPPDSYDKQTIKDSMQVKRNESLTKNKEWIGKHIDLARRNLADGALVWESNIQPVIEVCETQEQ